MGGTKIVVSTNLPLFRDGYPMTSAMEPKDPGVAVYFLLDQRPMAFACDRFQHVYENIEAIAKTIHALRGIARWGASDMMERAFTGFKALADGPSEDWRQVLGFEAFETVTRKMVDSQYRELVKQHHPDMGGDREDFERVMRAREAAIEELT
jgi:DnaJ-domain-containing protein 1